MYRPTTALNFSSELQAFQRKIEAMSDECKNIFQDPNRIVCVREVFVDTPPTKYPNITAIEAGLSADMSVIIATTAKGHVIPPVYIVRATQVSSKWFLPLPESKYTCHELGRHEFCEADWFPSDSLVICSPSIDLHATAVTSIFRHINEHVRNKLDVNATKKVCVFLPQNFASTRVEVRDVLDHFNMGYIMFPSGCDNVLDPYLRQMCVRFDMQILMHTSTLDAFCFEDRTTVQMKIMVALQAMRDIHIVHVSDSYEQCGLWPMRLISSLDRRAPGPRRVSKSPARTNLGDAS